MSLSEAIPSELEVLRRRINELETEKDELEETWRERVTLYEKEIFDLKNENQKLREELGNRIEDLEKNRADTDAENAELKSKLEEHESRIAKVEQGSPLKDVQPQVKTLTVGESDVDVKRVSDKVVEHVQPRKIRFEIAPSTGQGRNSHKKKGTENIAQALTDAIQGETNHREVDTSSEIMQMTEISRTARPRNSSSPLLDLAHLFDKASNAEFCTMKANEEETLCWVNFGKEFIHQYDDIINSSNGRIGEKKAKGIIYDEMLDHLAIIREKRFKEECVQLPKISRDTLGKKTRRSMKLVKLFEKIDNFSKHDSLEYESGSSEEIESATSTPQTSPAKVEPEVADLDDDDPDKEFFAAFERGCKNSINLEADESSDEESQNGTSASSSSSDSDSDESIDSNHLIHYESSDEESENETSVSSPNSDTVYDESDAEREEESKNETPQITDKQIFAALGYFRDIGTEDGQSDRSESIDHPKHDVKRILREEITRSEGISVQA